MLNTLGFVSAIFVCFDSKFNHQRALIEYTEIPLWSVYNWYETSIQIIPICSSYLYVHHNLILLPLNYVQILKTHIENKTDNIWSTYVRKPIRIMFKIKFTSSYLVITRKLSRNDEKRSRNYEKRSCNYEKIIS